MKHHARCRGERADGHCDCAFLDVISGLAAQLAESHAAHLESSRAWDREVKLTRAAALEEAAKLACRYVGKCNSNRCPCHAIRALAGQSAPRLYTLAEVERAIIAASDLLPPHQNWMQRVRTALTEGK